MEMALEFLADITTPLMMGILLGGLYALIALGLSLVFGVMKLINVAHGDLVLFSSYFAYAALTMVGIDPILSLVIGIPLLFVIGFAIQKYLLSRAFAISMEAPLIIAFGISLVLQNFQQIVWSPMSRGLTTSYALTSFGIGGVRVPLAYLLDFIAALVVMLLLREFLSRTYLGKAINAASQDRRAAQLMGINTGRVYAFAFAISMVTAALAGVFLGLTFPFTPQSGVSFLIIAFGVVIIGGLGSMLGTFIGGMVLGLAQTFGGYFFGAAAQMLCAYSVVIIVLAVRPQGIFGR
jgi:branched-chain amino acid transport system permease protein